MHSLYYFFQFSKNDVVRLGIRFPGMCRSPMSVHCILTITAMLTSISGIFETVVFTFYIRIVTQRVLYLSMFHQLSTLLGGRDHLQKFNMNRSGQ